VQGDPGAADAMKLIDVPEEARSASRAIRPCMLSFYFHPEYSGSAIQAHNLCRKMLKLGIAPFIVSANLSGNPARATYDGIPLYRLPLLKRRALQIPSFSASLLQFLIAHRQDYDLIHAHGALPHAAAAIAGRLLGKPTILKVAMAGSDIAFKQQGRLNGRINRALVNRFDSYIATTPEIVEEFAGEAIDPSRVELLPNGVDTDTFAPIHREGRSALRRRLELPDVATVTYVGIINGRKNIDGLLRIWRAVRDSGVDAHLLLLGPEPDPGDAFMRDLVAFVRYHDLASRVTFAGRRDPVAPYLQASDAFVFPSRREGMANSVLEAMSTGLPCLVSNTAGASAIIENGKNGYALDADDEPGFAKTLIELLEDAVLRDRVGAAARTTVVESFSLASTARRYLDLYTRLLSRSV